MFIPQNFFKTRVAPPVATPSRFVFSSSRCSSHQLAPRRATINQLLPFHIIPLQQHIYIQNQRYHPECCKIENAPLTICRRNVPCKCSNGYSKYTSQDELDVVHFFEVPLYHHQRQNTSDKTREAFEPCVMSTCYTYKCFNCHEKYKPFHA